MFIVACEFYFKTRINLDNFININLPCLYKCQLLENRRQKTNCRVLSLRRVSV